MGFLGDIVKSATSFAGDAIKFVGGAHGSVIEGVHNAAGSVVESVGNIHSNIITGVHNAVGGLVGKGVGMIFGSGVGNFVGGLVKGVGNVVGGVVKGVGKVIGGVVKGVGKVIGGAVSFIGKGIGSIVKGIGSFFSGLFGGGPSKEELRIAKQAVEDVKRTIREQYRILEEQVHAPMSQMVQRVEGGDIWRGDGADQFAEEVSGIHIPGAGRIENSFDLMIERLTQAVEIVENADAQLRVPVTNLGSSWRAIGAALG